MPATATVKPATSWTSWTVYPHCESGVPTGRGYVVRQTVGGSPVDARNYGGVEPIRTFARQGDAQRFADRADAATH